MKEAVWVGVAVPVIEYDADAADQMAFCINDLSSHESAVLEREVRMFQLGMNLDVPLLRGVAVGYRGEHVFTQFDIAKMEEALGVGPYGGIVIDLLNRSKREPGTVD